MRYNASILIALLILTNIAFGAVGDAGVSDGSKIVQSGNSYAAGMSSDSASLSPGFHVPSYQASGFSSLVGGNGHQQSQQGAAGGSSYGSGYASANYASGNYASSNYGSSNYGSSNYGSSNDASSAPQTAGPYQERMSADDLKFIQPQPESFQPDSSLNFIAASPPSGVSAEAYSPNQEQGNWYYPGSVTSRNFFYVQSSSGLKNIAGCSYGGYLPLWSDINSAGNFYVYEWYPGQWTPSVRWWGWSWQGYKKGWFTGDVPGWHILAYNCRDWSNYIYIYVWPSSGSAYPSSANAVNPAMTVSNPAIAATNAIASAANPTGPSDAGLAALPQGAPTPPDPNSENLMLPDFNLLQPSSGSYAISPGQTGYVQGANAPNMPNVPGVPTIPNVPQTSAILPGQGTYPLQGANPLQSTYPIQSTYPAQSSQSGCAACSDKTGYMPTYAVPSGTQAYQAVYPKPAVYRSNAYYVQTYPGQISTVAGVKCGGWLPLLSKIGSSGIYWSYEWSQCGSSPAYYCYAEIKSFGYKGIGWYQTWFMGNKPGWHILCYFDNDWSNYVYVYVWPA